jgi:hypothetical protein
MCSYVGSDLRWGSQPHHEDMRSTEYSNYSLPAVVGSRDTTESRLAGVKRVEKEPDSEMTERAHESMTMEDFEKSGAVDVEDSCCLTLAGCDVRTAVDSVTKRRGLVRLETRAQGTSYVCSSLSHSS